MGVYLPNMEIPDVEHGVRTINIYADGVVTNYAEEPIGKAIPVPDHGRLIDADMLNYTMLYKENWLSGTGVSAPAVWKSDIDDAPTIIPEEEG